MASEAEIAAALEKLKALLADIDEKSAKREAKFEALRAEREAARSEKHSVRAWATAGAKRELENRMEAIAYEYDVDLHTMKSRSLFGYQTEYRFTFAGKDSDAAARRAWQVVSR